MTCYISPPSLSVYGRAISIYVVSHVVQAPLGLFLQFVLKPSLQRTALALCVGIAVAAVPFLLHFSFEPVNQMVLSSVCFIAFFKNLDIAFKRLPAGALATTDDFVTYYLSTPEPRFADGKRVKPAPREIIHNVLTLLGHAAFLSALLSLLLPYPGLSPCSPSWFFGAQALNRLLQLWALHSFLTILLDVSSVLLLLRGFSPSGTFNNAIFGSRSFKEAWGQRWNIPVHVFLLRAVYKPMRKHWGAPKHVAALCTFAASGLLHEYAFSIHLASAWSPGKATLFFLLMGAIMIIEEAFISRCPEVIARVFHSLPSGVIAVAISLSVSPIYGPLFIDPWIDAGMWESISSMVPLVQCV